MRQIEQDSFNIGRSVKYRAQKITAPASDISNYFERRKIAGCDDRGDLPLRYGQHRGVKDGVCLRVLPEVTPDSFRKGLLHCAAAAFHGIFELPISVPINRQPKHAHKSAHRLRMVAA